MHESSVFVRSTAWKQFFISGTAATRRTEWILSCELLLQHARQPLILELNLSRAQEVRDSFLFSNRARCVSTLVGNQARFGRVLAF